MSRGEVLAVSVLGLGRPAPGRRSQAETQGIRGAIASGPAQRRATSDHFGQQTILPGGGLLRPELNRQRLSTIRSFSNRFLAWFGRMAHLGAVTAALLGQILLEPCGFPVMLVVESGPFRQIWCGLARQSTTLTESSDVNEGAGSEPRRCRWTVSG